MTQITRSYDDSKNASAALAELKANKFDNAELVSNGKGGSVISVDPPFGRGGLADAILNRHGPSKPLHNGASHGVSGSLLSSSTRLTGAPRLTDSRTTFGSLGFPELTNPNFFLSTLFGPLLTNSKPFSSLAASQKASAKLINDPAPFSSMLGLPVLSKH
ncbi:MAG: hypothetical protein HXX15_21065 [Rhodopseudomonas sp.]|uniref:hypothetical protein n=1 Tax=Rhodopseudomonas sp. TaxID=1078 RepID=UPI0017E8436F|nr:hypothetical protein [Rhodopseudomonas sp.]NVN88579.1 hypothetical protein [Rhodopseudomonas sp.]